MALSQNSPDHHQPVLPTDGRGLLHRIARLVLELVTAVMLLSTYSGGCRLIH